MTDSIFRQIETWAVGKINTAIVGLATTDRPKEVKEFQTDLTSMLAQGITCQFPGVWVFHAPTTEVIVHDDSNGTANEVRDHILVAIFSGNMKRPGDRRNQALKISEAIIPALTGKKHATLMGGSPLSYPSMEFQDVEIRPKEWAYVITLDFSYVDIV